MSLSACGGANQKANDYFQEDALLHEEIFGSVESAIESKAFRNLDPIGPAVPLIGVQQQTYTDSRDSKQYLAVRFVAVVNLPDLSTTIKWDRGIYEDDGDCHKAFDKPLVATTVYESIYDGSSLVNISAYEGYTHFATYTVRKIPTNKTGYFIKASLTIGNGEPSKQYATSVDLTKQVSFKFNTPYSGYFLQGKRGEEPNATTYADDGEIPAGNQARFTTSLAASDNFFVVYNYEGATPEESKFKILGSEILTGSEYANIFFEDTEGTSAKINVKASNDYVLYLDNSNILQSDEIHTTAIALQHGGVACSSADLYLGLDEDATFELTAVTTPAVVSDNVTWESSDTNVVTVSNGTVARVGAGTATVTATSNGQTATCAFTVHKVYEGAVYRSDVKVGSFDFGEGADKGDYTEYASLVSTVNTDDIIIMYKNGVQIYPGASNSDGNLEYNNEHLLRVKDGGANLSLYLKDYGSGYDTWFDNPVYTINRSASGVRTLWFKSATNEWCGTPAVFKAGESFSAYDKCGNLLEYGPDEWSFGTKDSYKSYISYNDGVYTALKDFEVDVYVKIDQKIIYFGTQYPYYFLSGSFNSWAYQDSNYKLVITDNAEYKLAFSVSKSETFKVTSDSDSPTWYPDGKDNNYSIDSEGNYIIYFDPNKRTDQGWYYDYFYVQKVVTSNS